MSARGLQALGTTPAAGRKRGPAKPSRSETEVNQAAALAHEARRMAEIAAEFAMFGLRVDGLEQSAWEASADARYRTAEPDADAVANDVVATDAPPRARLPVLPRRWLRLSPALPSALLRTLDWIFVLMVAELAARWSAGVSLGALVIDQAALFIIVAMCLKAGLWLTSAYRIEARAMRIDHSLGGLAIGAVAGLVLANVLAPDARAAGALAALMPASALAIAGVHAGIAVLAGVAHRMGAFSETVAVIGATSSARVLAARLQKSGEARVVAIIDDRRAHPRRRAVGVRVAGDVADLLQWPSLPCVDRVLVALPPSAEARIADLIARLRAVPNRVDLLIGYEAGAGESLSGAAVVCVSGRPHCHRRAFVKRTLDIIAGAVLLVVFAVPMLLIAAAIKLDGGPILFRQQRHGFNNAAFTLIKFRTMKRDAQAVTRVGAFLRRAGLDELPQLFNVLRGDMSLVGPRPHDTMSAAAGRAFGDIVAEYAHRHRVKPGITGLAQINGCRGAVRTPAALRRRLKLDLDYIEHTSLWLDLHILARTVVIMLSDIRDAISGKRQ